jgi:hypothetical protein
MGRYPVYVRSILFVIVIGLLGAVPLFSRTVPPAATVTINNNSGLELRHIYLSAVDNDNWSRDQLGDSVINNGASYTLNNLSCEGAEVRVIAEDQNGCFFYQNVSCGQSSTWSIMSSSHADCGN